jgi:hypothetical protein
MARNILDVRWVFKEQVGTDYGGRPQQRRGPPNAAAAVKTIRARPTVRGFKDQERKDIDRYAGSSARSSQKLLVSKAVLRGSDICTTDISKAFLQGVTYEELAKFTGEQQREVNVYFLASNIPLLRRVPGFETFEPTKEVLHCDKPGTGLLDAPLHFSMKLGIASRDKFGLAPSKTDPELCCRWDNGEFTCIVTKHVDDLKVAGKPEVVKFVLAEIQMVLGELKILWKDFEELRRSPPAGLGHQGDRSGSDCIFAKSEENSQSGVQHR